MFKHLVPILTMPVARHGISPGPIIDPMKFLSRLLSVTAITFAHGRCQVVRGKVGHHQLEALGACLAEAGVPRAEIWIAGNGRVTFSREIGPALHQRLRNIMREVAG